MMTRMAFLQAAGAAIALGYPCDSELVTLWNAFANEANAHFKELRAGIHDVKRHNRVMRSWEALTRSECW